MPSILDAFINQTYGSLDKARSADKHADLNPNAQPEHDPYFEDTTKENIAKKTEDEFQKSLIAQHFKNTPIKDSISIPTKLKEGSIDNKTQVHPQFQNYDHSLEQHRGHKLGLIKLHTEESNPNLDSGSINDMLDTMFSNDSNLIK